MGQGEYDCFLERLRLYCVRFKKINIGVWFRKEKYTLRPKVRDIVALYTCSKLFVILTS
jgi:hypothetical protein